MLNPRLNDEFNLGFSQDDVPFLIPHLREDLPLCIDPFLLWKADDPTWRELHRQVIGFLEVVRSHVLAGNPREAAQLLLKCEEQPSIGLGYAQGTKAGQSIGPELAAAIAGVFDDVPQLKDKPPTHLEEIQLLVPKVKEDRISDIAAAILKGALIDFTEEQAAEFEIPTRLAMIPDIWDATSGEWRPGRRAKVPFSPLDQSPILLVPLDWLRTLPWINYGDYYRSHFSQYVLPADRRRGKAPPKKDILAFNRANYQEVERYVAKKEELSSQAFPEYFFSPLSAASLRKRVLQIAETPSGKEDGADKAFEGFCFEFLQSVLFPELDFADSQVRTEGGTHIRDVVFYNDGKTDLLKEWRVDFGVRQLVFELKNVKGLEGEHVNQVYRYLGGDFGKLGVLVARTPPGRAVTKNIVDLHSAKGHVILALDDRDLDTMVNLKEAGHSASSVLKRKWIEFQRILPR